MRISGRDRNKVYRAPVNQMTQLHTTKMSTSKTSHSSVQDQSRFYIGEYKSGLDIIKIQGY